MKNDRLTFRSGDRILLQPGEVLGDIYSLLESPVKASPKICMPVNITHFQSLWEEITSKASPRS